MTLVKFKDCKYIKNKRDDFISEVDIKYPTFKILSNEKYYHNKTLAKCKIYIIENIKYFDLEEYKNIMKFDLNYILKCFK